MNYWVDSVVPIQLNCMPQNRSKILILRAALGDQRQERVQDPEARPKEQGLAPARDDVRGPLRLVLWLCHGRARAENLEGPKILAVLLEENRIV